MKKIANRFSILLVAASMFLAFAGLADAQQRNDRDIRDAVRSLNSKIDDFESEFRYQTQNNSSDSGQVSYLSDDIRGLKDSIRRFQDYYDKKRENRDDVTDLISAARRIDDTLRLNPQNRRIMDNWSDIRRQIDRLAANYGVTPDWNADVKPRNTPPLNPPVRTGTLSVGLSGSYDLDAARSENIDDIITDAKVASDQREDLKDKLTAPGQIALDIRGKQVTLATSNASPVAFTADGSTKTEPGPAGKTIRLRANVDGQTLTVSSLGGDTDYTITFTSLDDGRSLRVVRRITTDYLNQTVIAESIYTKTDSVAQLGINTGGSTDIGSGNQSDPNGGNRNDPNGGYSDNDQNNRVANGSSNGGYNNGGRNNRNNGGRYPSVSSPRPGNYIVPNGVTLTGTLENGIDTGVSQNNDRFRLTVQSPDEFRGATVEGYISNVQRSGKVTGQATVTLNFEKITLRNGQTYDFAAYLQNAQSLNGKNYEIDNESTIRGENQTRQTAKRGGIGGGIGAVIGAIAGGAKGAAIGAVIGAGGGAGTVAVQGKTDIQLFQGSTITFQSTSPVQRDR